MKRTYHALPFVILLLFGMYVFAPARQMVDTAVNGCVKVIDTVNKRERCMAGNGVTLIYRATGINLNAGANTDVTPTITNLPARYIVRRVTFENASGTPTLATISLRTAAAGGGTAVVNAQALAALSATTVYLDATVAVTSTVLTASTLTFRNIVAAGGAMTVDATVEITPLN